jgi:nucleoid-associated protein YgaU
MARQSIHAAEVAGARASELEAARAALTSAVSAAEQAQALLAEGAVEGTIRRIDAALSDCLTAEDLARQAQLLAAQRTPTGQERYTVVAGDTLWGISAREVIYNNSLMWPIIYKANQQQIRDPDLIFPRQVFVIPRDYSPQEAETAIQRARQRGRWRLRDGR